MQSICLTAGELAELTGKRRASAQRRALRFMAIDHKLRTDGSLMVLREHLSGKDGTRASINRTEPNWG